MDRTNPTLRSQSSSSLPQDKQRSFLDAKVDGQAQARFETRVDDEEQERLDEKQAQAEGFKKSEHPYRTAAAAKKFRVFQHEEVHRLFESVYAPQFGNDKIRNAFRNLIETTKLDAGMMSAIAHELVREPLDETERLTDTERLRLIECFTASMPRHIPEGQGSEWHVSWEPHHFLRDMKLVRRILPLINDDLITKSQVHLDPAFIQEFFSFCNDVGIQRDDDQANMLREILSGRDGYISPKERHDIIACARCLIHSRMNPSSKQLIVTEIVNMPTNNTASADGSTESSRLTTVKRIQQQLTASNPRFTVEEVIAKLTDVTHK